MSSEKQATTSEYSSESAGTIVTITDANINDSITNNKENINDTEAQTVVDEGNTGKESEKNHQPQLILGKVEMILIMIGMSLGVFLAALDQTIVSTALPAIASDFNALSQISWVATSYLLTTTSFQPTYGKFSDIFGRKATFLFAIIIFEIGSLLCGLAPNMTSLIIFRAVAGIGGGGIISLVMIMISDIVPLEDRGKYQGLIGGAFGIASVVGPLLGGAFTDHVTWRWSFYINLPLGAVTIIVVIFLFRIPRPKNSLLQMLKRVDYLGTIIMGGATVAILLALSWGGNEYKWSSPTIIILFLVGVFGFASFALNEAKFAVDPIAPPHLFKNLNVIGCYLTNVFQGMAFLGLIYYMPLYFQVVKGDTATQSGLELIPYILGIVVASVVSGQFISRSDLLSYRAICAIGSVFLVVGAGLITLWDEHSGRGAQIGYMLIAGLGVGITMQTTLICGQQIVSHDDIAVITSLLNFFRTVGGVFGVAIVGTVFTNVLTRNLENLSLPLDMINTVKQSAIAVNHLPENLKTIVIVAYVDALRTAFITVIPMGILCFIATLFMGNHKTPKRKEGEERVINTLEF